MKKFAIAMVAVLAMFAGSACSGSTSSPTTKIGEAKSTTTTGWDDVDKASLLMKLVDMSGTEHLMTQSQQMCMYDWFTSHYKSMAEVESSTDSADPAFDACIK